MQTIRNLWSKITRRSDPRDKLFEIPESTAIVDRRPFYERASAELQTVLLPVLVRIVVCYAADIVYTWPDAVDRSVSVIGNNRVVGTNIDKKFRRIVAPQSVTDGFCRWRILIEFGPADVGSVAVGASTAAPGMVVWNTDAPDSEFDILRSMDALIRHPDTNGVTDDGRPFQPFPPTAHRGMAVVEFDPSSRTMTTSFGRNGPLLVLTDRLADVGRWHPCIILIGAVSATILAWPNDV
jgi:hypothetical protein